MYSHIFLFSIWPHLGPFLHFFGPFGAIFFGPLGLIVWLGSGSKTFLEPTYVDNQLWFWKYSHIFLFSIWPHLGPFLHFFGTFGAIFWPFGAYCVVGVRFKNIFGTYLCRKSTLVLEIQPYLFVYNLAKFGAFFLHFLVNLNYGSAKRKSLKTLKILLGPNEQIYQDQWLKNLSRDIWKDLDGIIWRFIAEYAFRS